MSPVTRTPNTFRWSLVYQLPIPKIKWILSFSSGLWNKTCLPSCQGTPQRAHEATLPSLPVWGQAIPLLHHEEPLWENTNEQGLWNPLLSCWALIPSNVLNTKSRHHLCEPSATSVWTLSHIPVWTSVTSLCEPQLHPRVSLSHILALSREEANLDQVLFCWLDFEWQVKLEAYKVTRGTKPVLLLSLCVIVLNQKTAQGTCSTKLLWLYLEHEIT